MPKQKLFSITLSILMLLSLLGGCRSATVSSTAPSLTSSAPSTEKHDPLAVPPELTEESMSKIYYLTKVKKEARSGLYFFGAFEDSYAVLCRIKSEPDEPCWETVNGLTFYYPDGYPILWVYKISQKGDTAGHLWEMFHRKLITEEQLQEIYDNYYSAYPELLPLAQAVRHFGSDDMEAISRDLLLYTAEELGWDETNMVGQFRLVYYCTVDGKHVFRWIPDYKSGFLEYQFINVGGYRFGHPEFFQLYVYFDEELMTLQEAYDRGLFSREQIRRLYVYHCLSDI